MAGQHIPRKRFGQHFLHDKNIIARIVDAITPEAGDRLLEIGPGLGALTRPLLEIARRLEVIELDRDVIPQLKRHCRGIGELTVYQADALQIDLQTLCDTAERFRIVGNLPYNISTPLIFHLLGQSERITDMHFMLQKEVVERMTAKAGETAYGRLSVMVQYYCQVQYLFSVAPAAFSPPPKVESAFLRLVPHVAKPVDVADEFCFHQLVKQAFSQRRKTLRNSLKSMLGAQTIAAAGVNPSLRPEVLGLAQFAALSNAYFRVFSALPR